MGNQQERSLEYVAGITDGEGSLSIMWGKPQAASFYVLPVIQIQMNHKETILEVASILKKHDIGHYLYWNQKRGVLQLAVKRYKRCRSFLDAVGPWLLTKQEQAEIVSEFIDSRLSRGRGASPTPHEIGLIERLQGINSHQTLKRKPLSGLMKIALEKSSETIRSAD